MTAALSAARRLAATLGNVLLAVVVLGCAAYLVPAVLGYERYVITGGSMSGSIEKGSVVFEKPRPVADLAVGDVITYLPPPDSGVGNLVTHRITDISTDDTGQLVLRTKGDANDGVDPWTFSLVGDEQPVAEFSVPLVGYAMIALADRETRMVVIGVPAAVIALLSLVELLRNVAGMRGGRRPEETAGAAAPVDPVLSPAGATAP